MWSSSVITTLWKNWIFMQCISWHVEEHWRYLTLLGHVSIKKKAALSLSSCFDGGRESSYRQSTVHLRGRQACLAFQCNSLGFTMEGLDTFKTGDSALLFLFNFNFIFFLLWKQVFWYVIVLLFFGEIRKIWGITWRIIRIKNTIRLLSLFVQNLEREKNVEKCGDFFHWLYWFKLSFRPRLC